MKRLVIAVVALAVVGLAGAARAEDKPNPTGTWKWTVEIQDNKFEVTLKLKLDGEKLTGTITGRDNKEIAIEDGKFKDGEISFKVVRERDGNKFTQMYSGKVSGDSFKGKSETEVNGEKRKREFEAKRAKD